MSAVSVASGARIPRSRRRASTRQHRRSPRPPARASERRQQRQDAQHDPRTGLVGEPAERALHVGSARRSELDVRGEGRRPMQREDDWQRCDGHSRFGQRSTDQPARVGDHTSYAIGRNTERSSNRRSPSAFAVPAGQAGHRQRRQQARRPQAGCARCAPPPRHRIDAIAMGRRRSSGTLPGTSAGQRAR